MCRARTKSDECERKKRLGMGEVKTVLVPGVEWNAVTNVLPRTFSLSSARNSLIKPSKSGAEGKHKLIHKKSFNALFRHYANLLRRGRGAALSQCNHQAGSDNLLVQWKSRNFAAIKFNFVNPFAACDSCVAAMQETRRGIVRFKCLAARASENGERINPSSGRRK